jgi:hypothetical protein
MFLLHTSSPHPPKLGCPEAENRDQTTLILGTYGDDQRLNQ